MDPAWQVLGISFAYAPEQKPRFSLRALKQRILQYHAEQVRASGTQSCLHDDLGEQNSWPQGGNLRKGPTPFPLQPDESGSTPPCEHTHTYNALTCKDCRVKLKFDLGKLATGT
jgi:hypothetical protein